MRLIIFNMDTIYVEQPTFYDLGTLTSTPKGYANSNNMSGCAGLNNKAMATKGRL